MTKNYSSNPLRIIGTLAILALTLAGCSLTEFKRPESELTAKVRLTTDSGDFITRRGSIIEWRSFDDEDCTFGQTLGYLNLPTDASGHSSRTLPSGNSELMAGYREAVGVVPIERLIPADKDFVFSISRKNSQLNDVPCNLYYVLPLQPDQQYEIIFTENEKACRLSVVKLYQAENGKVQRQPYVPFLRKAKHTCY